MSELALKLIREAKASKAKKLDLGNCGLTELPGELFELVWLEGVYLSKEGSIYDFEAKEEIIVESQNKGERNNIKYFSSKIKEFQHLKILLANGNYGNKWDLKDLSPLKELTNLQVLDVSETQVSDLSPLKGLANLQQLNVFFTQVSDLSNGKKINVHSVTLWSSLRSYLYGTLIPPCGKTLLLLRRKTLFLYYMRSRSCTQKPYMT